MLRRAPFLYPVHGKLSPLRTREYIRRTPNIRGNWFNSCRQVWFKRLSNLITKPIELHLYRLITENCWHLGIDGEISGAVSLTGKAAVLKTASNRLRGVKVRIFPASPPQIDADTIIFLYRLVWFCNQNLVLRVRQTGFIATESYCNKLGNAAS